ATITKALGMRPDLKSAQQNIDIDDLQIRTSTNALRPDLSLTGTYTAQGRGGTAFVRTNVFNDTGDKSVVTSILPGGFSDAFSHMWGFGYPIYGFGLRLRLPTRNREARIDRADPLFQKRRAAMNIRTTEQQ